MITSRRAARRAIPTPSPFRDPPPTRRRAFLLLWLGLLSAALGCRVDTATPYNVVLILVDTLRADRLGDYGYQHPTAPALERFSKRAIRFEDAFSQTACTYPSVASMLTSRYPGAIEVEGWGRFSIPESLTSLPETLRSNGYETHAVSASTIVRRSPSHHNRAGGHGRGFDTFFEDCMEAPASCVTEQALQRLGDVPEPFFLYLHYLDPHGPYQPPEGHPRAFAPERPPGVRETYAQGQIVKLLRSLYTFDRPLGLRPAEREHLSRLYDEEIRYVDGQLAKVLDAIAAQNLDRRTMIVIASDHGEALLETDDLGHCRNILHNTVIATPLWFRLPDSDATGPRSGLVQNVDIVPTILDYLGLPARGPLDGRSLRPLIEQERRVNRYAFASQGVKRAVLDERFKLVLDVERDVARLYHYRRDPLEKVDLLARHPGIARRLRTVLDRWIDRFEGPMRQEQVEQGNEITRQLEALGYL